MGESYIHAVQRGVHAILSMPRQLQPQAIERLCTQLVEFRPNEDWNTSFGPDSLFDAWTATTLTRGLYAANLLAIRPHLRPGFTAIEIGGGDGRLWASMLTKRDTGTLHVIDPSPGVHDQVARRLPKGVELVRHVALVQDVELPPADVVVCSLTLHHVRGLAEKARVLAAIRAAVPDGLFVLNEANVHCEDTLAAGDPVLRDNLIDSYVRRCAHALVDEIDARPGAARNTRLAGIVHLWCLEQVALADAPVEDRDVYELDVARWERLLVDAGFSIQGRRCTDPYGLFFQYVLRPS
ncbi:MAG: class I SAM-dependent methyltransferase [Proteobacteria bacterium]|nr:class I SAM-dependent methyltransferase [Pseudomonadota bacterium]MCP4915300.1 class I SAM-dependent methyltransferase [Pseudomonadota bacterium]